MNHIINYAMMILVYICSLSYSTPIYKRHEFKYCQSSHSVENFRHDVLIIYGPYMYLLYTLQRVCPCLFLHFNPCKSPLYTTDHSIDQTQLTFSTHWQQDILLFNVIKTQGAHYVLHTKHIVNHYRTLKILQTMFYVFYVSIYHCYKCYLK